MFEFCYLNIFQLLICILPCLFEGTKMLNHVLNICEKDGTFDNIYL